MVTGIALVSGGLDSILAVKVLQEQGINVIGLSFETPFFNARAARKAAREIDIPLVVKNITKEHLFMLQAPRYGYGKHMNPCIDCHTLMLKKAGEAMEEKGADFVSTGEVLGQRPMSQNRQSLHIVASRSGYGDFIIRPLSARLLPETQPEREGKVDRAQLCDIQGRSRKRQIEMAERYGVKSYSNPAGGCLLTEPVFSRRLKDLFEHQENVRIRDVELLKVGRHLRIDDDHKIIVGRKEGENSIIERHFLPGDCMVRMRDFPGPTVLIPGDCSETVLSRAAAICALYSDAPGDRAVTAVVTRAESSVEITVHPAVRGETAELMI